VAWAELESKSFAEARAETLGIPQIGGCQSVGRRDLDRGREVRGGGARWISTRLDDPLPILAVALDMCQLCGLFQRRKRVSLQSTRVAILVAYLHVGVWKRWSSDSKVVNGEQMADRVHSDSAMQEEVTFQCGTEISTKIWDYNIA
jgi:hypothetical protein